MSEGHHAAASSSSLEEDGVAAVSTQPPPPVPAVLAFNNAADADGAAVSPFFDDASTIGSAGDGSITVLDSWLRDNEDGHFYCPRHPDQRKPYKPHRNSICAECLLESQRNRQSLEQRKRVVEQKLQRLLEDKPATNDEEQHGGEAQFPNYANVDASNGGEDGSSGATALKAVGTVMQDWTNSLRMPSGAASAPAAARPSGSADRSAAHKSGDEPPPPPPMAAGGPYAPPPSPHPPEPHMSQPQQLPPAAAGYPLYAYSPQQRTGISYNGQPYPSPHPQCLPQNMSGYLPDAPPAGPAQQHPTYASLQIPPSSQHQHVLNSSPSEFPPQVTTAAAAPAPPPSMHPSYPHAPDGWTAYGSPAPAAAPGAAAPVPDAFVGHLFHMMERQDMMMVQKIKECDDLKKALDEVTKQIHELRVDNAQLRERVVQQGEQMRHELDLIRREVVAAVVAAAPKASSARPQHVHRTPSPPSGEGRMRRNRTLSRDDDAQVAEPISPVLLADSPHHLGEDDGAKNGETDELEIVDAVPAAASNESPFLPDEHKSDLSGVKLEPSRRWESTLPSRTDLSPPVQWFPFLSDDVKDCPFTVFVDDDNDFHDPFGVGAGATNFEGPRKGAAVAPGAVKRPQAPSTNAAPSAVVTAAAPPRQDIDWERSELAV